MMIPVDYKNKETKLPSQFVDHSKFLKAITISLKRLKEEPMAIGI
jgi:hypothetical protein